MNFTNLSPALFWSALLPLAAAVIILYILKLRRRTYVVPFSPLWEQLFRQKETTDLFKRLRQWLSLALQLLFLTLLMLAWARPTIQTFKDPPYLILAVDVSASMSAPEGEGDRTRLELALQEAGARVEQMADGQRMLLLAAGNPPRVLVPFTDEKATLRQALRELQPGESDIDWKATVKLVRALCDSERGDQIVFLSDRTRVKARPLGEEFPDALFLAFGRPLDNVAIVDFNARRNFAHPADFQILARIRNFGREKTSGTLRIRKNGQLLEVADWTLGPSEEAPFSFKNSSLASDLLVAEVECAEAFRKDNHAFAVLPEKRKIHALLVTEANNLFLEAALRVNSHFEVTRLPPASYNPAAVHHDLVLFNGCALEPGERGIYLYLGPEQSSPWWTLGHAISNPIVSDWDEKHPLLRWVAFKDVNFFADPSTHARVRSILLTPKDLALARCFEDVLLALREEEKRTLLCASFRVEETDLPLRIAFPIFLANLGSLALGHPPGAQTHYPLNEWIELPADEGDPAVTDPSGQPVAVLSSQGKKYFQARERGLYASMAGGKTHPYAFNAFYPEEYDLAAGAEETPSPEASKVVSSPTGGSAPWKIAVIFFLLASTAEWWAYHRRITV